MPAQKQPPEPGSEPLANSRHERFACELAKGKSQDESYQLAGFEANPSNASRLNRNEQVLQRVKWLKSQAADDTVLTLKEKRQIAAQIARGGEKDADRLNAIKVDNDMAVDGAEAGANAAITSEVEVIGKLMASLIRPGSPIVRRNATKEIE